MEEQLDKQVADLDMPLGVLNSWKAMAADMVELVKVDTMKAVHIHRQTNNADRRNIRLGVEVDTSVLRCTF